MENASTKEHESRKTEHLKICAERAIESVEISTGFENYQFLHNALPDINMDEIDLRRQLFTHSLDLPFVISSMTGGCEEGGRINYALAEAAQELGIAMGVGSERVGILDNRLAYTYQARSVAPDILLFANLGAIQLNNGFTIDHCRAAVEMIDADALILHLNPLQESVQPKGNTNFEGIIAKIEEICSVLEVPVIVKEVGHGLSGRAARLLAEAGVAVIDTAGAGGTSWSRVESLRSGNGKAYVGKTFADWGIPTSKSIIMCRKAVPELPLIASGGLRSGLDAAKAIALGADFAGFGLPLLRAAFKGVDTVVERLRHYREELLTAMFCIGARNIDQLKQTTALEQQCQCCGGYKYSEEIDE